MTSLSTLSDVKRNGYRLYGNCQGRNCSHGEVLPIDRLIEKFGEDYVFVGDTRIAACLRCKRCGHRGSTLSLQPPSSGR